MPPSMPAIVHDVYTVYTVYPKPTFSNFKLSVCVEKKKKKKKNTACQSLFKLIAW